MLQIVTSLMIVIDNTSKGWDQGSDTFIVQASLMNATAYSSDIKRSY